MKKSTLRAMTAAFLNLTFWVTIASGQITTATVSGTVVDETAGILPGVTVTIRNLETGAARNVVTDGGGDYRVTGLPIGEYEVRAELAGFHAAVQRGIRLTTGREATVDLRLTVGDVTEEVVVVAEVPLVNTTSGALGNVVELAEIQSIPIQGRNIANIPLLEPGVHRVTTAREGERKLSAGGARPTMNLFLLDGVNIQGFDDHVPTGASGNMLGLEGVREIKVETNAYSAEFGRAGGAIIQVATKSGTNRFTGSSYWYHRNEGLEAANFFDVQGKPDFSRNQFGFSLGGRVVRDRTFFFGSYEGLRDRLGITGILGTLTADAREGRLQNPSTRAFQVFTVNPKVRPYLGLFPLPNGPVFDRGDGTGDYSFQYTQPTDEHHFQGRIDHRFNAENSVFARYTVLDSDRSDPGPAPAFGQMGNRTGALNQYGSMEYQRIFSARFLNTVRVGFTRTTPFEEEAMMDTSIPLDLFLVPTQSVPGEIGVSGLATLGKAIPRGGLSLDRYQLMNNSTVEGGNYSLRFGVNLERMELMGNNPGRNGGLYTFGGLEAFLKDATPSRFRGVIKPGSDDPVRNMFQTLVGTYFQSDFRPTSRLTLNAGIRWEFTTVPTEAQDRLGNLRGDLAFLHSATLNDISTGDPWFQLSKKNFEPRLGFAWDVTGDGKTSVRGGGGIFHNQLGPWLYRTSAFRSPPFLSEIETRNASMPFPNMYGLCIANDPLCIAIDTVDQPGWEMDTPYILQFNFGLEREILPLTTFGVAYAGSRGKDLALFADVNSYPASEIDGRLVFPASVSGRPNRNFDYMRKRFTGGESWYDSLQLRLTRRYHAGLQFRASYTLSKFIDQQPGSQSASDSDVGGNNIYFYDLKVAEGPTNFDQRHNFTLNVFYKLPFGRDQRWGGDWGPLTQGLLGGWQISGLLAAISGSPGTVQVGETLGDLGVNYSPADLVDGGDSNPVLGGHEQYYDPSQFRMSPARTIGNVGRGTLIGPGLATLDLALAKEFPLAIVSDQAKLEFRLEAFNALNRANLGFPDLVVFDNRGRPNGSAGRITTTTTTARQFQVAMRLQW